ncbi:MAG: PAS domain S-box protein [Ferruginibacter sp.]
MDQLIDFFSKLFNYSDWPPRWHCGKWSEFHGWLYIVSDLLIWSAYFTIPIVIIKYISRKSDAQFVKLYFLFAAFILACGATHFLDALSFWIPVYRLNALVRLITAVISWATVFFIIRYLPLAFSFRSKVVLEKEIEQRKIVESELRFSEEKLQSIYNNAPDAIIVIHSNGNIIKWNPAAEKMLGWKEEEVLGKVLNEIIVPEDMRPVYISEMKKFLKTNMSELLEKTSLQTLVHKNKTLLLVEFTVSAVKIKDDYLFIGFVRNVTSIKKAETALKDSEERYRLLTSEVHDYAIIMLTPQGNINSWNEGAQRIKGYADHEIIGKHFSVLYPQECIESNLPTKELVIAQREGRYTTEGWRVKKDGSLFWANVVITALKRDGVIKGFSKITRDNTERKKTEEEIQHLNTSLEQRVVERTEALQQSELKYRRLFENNPMPMWVIELPSLKFMDVNEAALSSYGYSRQEFLSMSALDIRPSDEKKRFLEYDHSISAGIRHAGVWKHLRKDGSIIYVEVNSHKLIFDNKNARLVLSVDVTERKKAEESLDFALEAGQIGIWELDLVKDASIRNLRHDQIFGYTVKVHDWGAKDLLAHIHPDDLTMVEDSFNESLKTKSWVIETRIIWPDGSIHYVLITGKITEDNKEKPLEMLGTVIDITKMKEAEAEILGLNNELEQRVKIRTRELYSANKELESFSYSVSHDLRAPLRAIYGYSQILLEDYKASLDEEGDRLLNRIIINAKKMGQLIDELLEFSRLGKTTLNKTTIDINKLVDNVIVELGQSNKYHQNIIVGELGVATADQATIHLVFQNLLLNATKYSSKKDNPIVEVGITETVNGTAWFVKDNGAGFDMTYYDKLFGVFQRFHRQDEFEGTGVGLAIVQSIVLKHGGQVWAESVVNEGSTFYFTLQ